MRVTMLLADAAQVADGKLNILGGGWSIIGPDPTPSAIGLLIKVPWDQANRRHRFELGLLDADGNPVLVPSDADADVEGQPIKVDGEFEVGRPAGLLPGTPIDAVLALNVPPLPLPPGGRYVWELRINGRTEDDWQLPFTTRPAVSRLAS